MKENILLPSVKSMQGKTLYTVRGKPFIINSVDDTSIIITPESTGKSRRIYWDEIIAAYDYLLANLSVTVKSIRDSGASEMNPTYVTAVLLECMSAVYLDDENRLHLRT